MYVESENLRGICSRLEGREAGDAATKAAECSVKLKDKFESGNLYQEAASCYKKVAIPGAQYFRDIVICADCEQRRLLRTISLVSFLSNSVVMSSLPVRI